MATCVFLTQTGGMYSADSPTTATDYQVCFPSTYLLSALTGTPIDATVAANNASQLVDEAGLNQNNYVGVPR